ncbi:hypothetical protein D3C73_1553860 [compost metagenome]
MLLIALVITSIAFCALAAVVTLVLETVVLAELTETPPNMSVKPPAAASVIE